MHRIEHETNEKNGRFVLYDNDELAGELSYVWTGETKFIIDHTNVEEAFGGRGHGKKLVLEAIEYARKNNLKIIPLCPYAKSLFDKDESYNDVLF